MKKNNLVTIFLLAISVFAKGQNIENLVVENGKLFVKYTGGSITKTQLDDLNGSFGTHGIAENNAGDLHLRGFWGVVIDKNGGNYNEHPAYNNGVNPAGGCFAVRTRTSITSFRTDFIIRNNGNIGIGTTSPTNKLEVNGTIHTKEIKVDMNSWSDFVFHPNYTLRPLKEVNTYIQQNGHLPEIPTAKEVEENGVSLGEMNAKLLQKIEELTLYTIEQQKAIDKLLEVTEEQNKMINRLKDTRSVNQ